MAVSALSLLWVERVAARRLSLFGLGIGWNLSFVAATAPARGLRRAVERGKLLGFNDLLAGPHRRRAGAGGRRRAVGDRRRGAGDRGAVLVLAPPRGSCGAVAAPSEADEAAL